VCTKLRKMTHSRLL